MANDNIQAVVQGSVCFSARVVKFQIESCTYFQNKQCIAFYDPPRTIYDLCRGIYRAGYTLYACNGTPYHG